jgi:hypothetical protein
MIMSKLKKEDAKKEMHSLNEQLYNEFFIQELEARLETDPMAVAGLMDSFMDASAMDCFTCNICFSCEFTF